MSNFENSKAEVLGYYSNLFFERAQKIFFNQLNSLKPERYKAALNTFDKVSQFVSSLDCNTISITLTVSDSLLYRFTVLGSQYEFTLEAYMEYNPADPDDVEAILHIYKNGNREDSFFGTVKNLHDKILSLISTNVCYVYQLDKTTAPAFNIPQRIPVPVGSYS